MRPSFKVMSILANSDQSLFEHLMAREGLDIVGVQGSDPLEMSIQEEAVSAIASTLTESIYDPLELTQRQQNLKRLAESVGYIVALGEGLDQMSGTDYNPIKGKLRHPDKPSVTPAGEEEAAPGAEGEAAPAAPG